MRFRLFVIAAACVAVGATTFVVLHSGAAGDATCERSRFVPSSGFSAWPPGVRCSYGLPVRTDVVVNGWFVPVVGLLALVFVVVGGLLADRARSSPGARAAP